ncbi:MAG: phosphoserine transaminase [Oligoflexia bacterium]|nr:phosphoserine transaminase [Oligoflexia bacterium]
MFEQFKIPPELIPSDPRFGCGPSLVPMEFVKALYDKGPHLLGTSHRKPAVKKVVKSIQDGLRTYFKIPSDYSVVLGNGGATFLFDMIAVGMVEKKVTHFTCGEFSEKWFQASAQVPWITAEQISVAYGQGICAKDVSDADLICATLNETSTGVQLPELPKIHPGALLAIDATSGAGQVPCDISKVDCFFFSPQKVFASDGGLWIAILSPKALERVLRLAKAPAPRYIPQIMSWKEAIDNSDKNQTLNTPAIATLFFLNEQVKLMNSCGYERATEEAKMKASLLYGWAQEKNYLSVYVKEERFRSIAVACIDVDDKFPVDPLIKILEDRGIAYGIDGYRKLKRNQLRISLFHNIKLEDLRKLTKLISLAIESE